MSLPNAAPAAEQSARRGVLDVASLEAPPVLIVNPRAGQKLGLSTNTSTVDAVVAALEAAGVAVRVMPTERANHAVELAREAAEQGCQLVIAAGGDGTVAEAGQGLVGTNVALGIMPLGSIMNVARTLCIPRDLDGAARTIAEGRWLVMDLGKVDGSYFLEAGGAGLAAGLFGYFDRLDSGAGLKGVLRGLVRFMRRLGSPRLVVTADGRRMQVRSPMVIVANGPFVGAAYALAPDARVDDGLLDVVIFRQWGVLRLLLHLALVAGGRRLSSPPEAMTMRVRTIEIATRRRRALPVHADGSTIGATPTRFEVVPASLRVIVGQPGPDEVCAWGPAT